MGWQLHGTKNCAMPLHMAVDQPWLLLVQLMEFLRSKHPTMAQVLEVVLGDIGTTAHTCLLSNRLCGCVCVCVCVCCAVLHRLQVLSECFPCAWLLDTAEHSDLTVLSACGDRSVDVQPFASNASAPHPLGLA